MSHAKRPVSPDASLLSQQLRWFITLRWLAGLAAIAGAAVDYMWLHHFGSRGTPLLATGAGILVYNALLLLALRPLAARAIPRQLLTFAWAQLLLDFAALSILIVLTGGHGSPLFGFFVFHMVFASLLLPRAMAYAAAVAAMAISGTAMAISGTGPRDQADWLRAAGEAVVLLGVVFLSNRITRAIRRQRRRLIRQNRRIKRMSRQVRRQHRLMAQHEKMVALGQMAAGVAHEIANPLASMDGVLQLAQRNPDRPRPDLVSKLREQVARIHQIVQQMRSFSHPSDGQWQHLPINEVVEQSLDILRFDRRLKRTRLVRELAADAGSLPLLPQSLQQVIVNLVTNAFDATEESTDPAVTIRTFRRDGHVVIEVADNGHGIRPEHLKRLFEPFFTTKQVGKGTGLGLSISYSLVERQGGQLSVRSEFGRGATFVIRLRDRSVHSQNRESPETPTVKSGNQDT